MDSSMINKQYAVIQMLKSLSNILDIKIDKWHITYNDAERFAITEAVLIDA